MILVVYAHPYPSRSRACAALLSAIKDHPGVDVRSLYELYPDFDIDGEAERSALDQAALLVWLHPLYWFGVPALLKHWLDHVLADVWSSQPGDSLKGKDCVWVSTAAGTDDVSAFEAPLRQTAIHCGMTWLEPFHVDGRREVADEALREAGRKLRARLDEWSKARPP
jgi:glutathione-regulated potassium-efflux system ancillary protein KefF